MAFHVRDMKTDTLVRDFARKHRVGITEAVQKAIRMANEQEQKDTDERRREIDALLAEIDARPRTGLKADKAFFDELSGD